MSDREPTDDDKTAAIATNDGADTSGPLLDIPGLREDYYGDLDESLTRYKGDHLANTTKAVDEAYARYDADPRVNGPDGMDAFREAVMAISGPDFYLVGRYRVKDLIDTNGDAFYLPGGGEGG